MNPGVNNRYLVPGTLAFNSGSTFTGVGNALMPEFNRKTYSVRQNETEIVGGVGATSLWTISGDAGDLITRPNVEVNQSGQDSNLQWIMMAVAVATLLATLWYSSRK